MTLDEEIELGETFASTEAGIFNHLMTVNKDRAIKFIKTEIRLYEEAIIRELPKSVLPQHDIRYRTYIIKLISCVKIEYQGLILQIYLSR